jgi:hypothetical protein
LRNCLRRIEGRQAAYISDSSLSPGWNSNHTGSQMGDYPSKAKRRNQPAAPSLNILISNDSWQMQIQTLLHLVIKAIFGQIKHISSNFLFISSREEQRP